MAELKRIVRLMSTDIDGNLQVGKALRKIKGISFMFSSALCKITGLDNKQKIGNLSDAEMRNVENVLKGLMQPGEKAIPSWMLNKRKDNETSDNLHITGTEIAFRKREEINFMQRIRCYRGVRHAIGQPVRGQRTKGSFRVNKSVGVTKKKVMPAKAASATQAATKPAAKEEKKK